MSAQSMTGIILSGGENSRMGRNKAFLVVDGERLIDRMIRIYRGLFAEVILVTNQPLDYLDLDVTLVTDIYPGRKALGGIYTGLFYANSSHAFVAACDMPCLNAEFIAHMMERALPYDIVVPEAADGLQPLHAFYSRKCLHAIKNSLQRDRLKITGFYKGMKILYISEETIQAFDPGARMFVNVNTPEDLMQLKSF